MKIVGLLNTSILTHDGEYRLKTISLEEAKSIVRNSELDSAIGHQATAEIMTTLLETPVEVNRKMFIQQIGQSCLVFKLNGRPEEGTILSADEIEEIGYSFKLLERLS